MDKRLRLKAMLFGYAFQITVISVANNLLAVESALLTGITAYLIFMALDHKESLKREKQRQKYSPCFNSGRLIKHRFWFWLSIIMCVILTYKNQQLINFISEGIHAQ